MHGSYHCPEIGWPYIPLQRYGDMYVKGKADVDDLLRREEGEVLAFEVVVCGRDEKEEGRNRMMDSIPSGGALCTKWWTGTEPELSEVIPVTAKFSK